MNLLRIHTLSPNVITLHCKVSHINISKVNSQLVKATPHKSILSKLKYISSKQILTHEYFKVKFQMSSHLKTPYVNLIQSYFPNVNMFQSYCLTLQYTLKFLTHASYVNKVKVNSHTLYYETCNQSPITNNIQNSYYLILHSVCLWDLSHNKVPYMQNPVLVILWSRS